MEKIIKTMSALLLCEHTLVFISAKAQLLEPDRSVQITYPIGNSVFQWEPLFLKLLKK